jgi:hypothetical protein
LNDDLAIKVNSKFTAVIIRVAYIKAIIPEIAIFTDQMSISFKIIALITKLNKPKDKNRNGAKIIFKAGFNSKFAIVSVPAMISKFLISVDM